MTLKRALLALLILWLYCAVNLGWLSIESSIVVPIFKTVKQNSFKKLSKAANYIYLEFSKNQEFMVQPRQVITIFKSWSYCFQWRYNPTLPNTFSAITFDPIEIFLWNKNYFKYLNKFYKCCKFQSIWTILNFLSKSLLSSTVNWHCCPVLAMFFRPFR